jgi:hypothetical protein
MDNMHRTHNKSITLRKKVFIENFKVKCDFLEECGWEAKYHIDNWTKKGHQDENGYWVSYPEYSIDDAYNKCKESITLSIKERDIIISLLNDSLTNGKWNREERDLLKKLQTT